MMRWRIYYDDKSTFSNEDGSWTEAPKHGVICVVVRDPTGVWGRFVNSGYAPQVQCAHCGRNLTNHYFVCPPDMEEPYPTWDLTDFCARFDKPEDADPYIKTGRQISQALWTEIMDIACLDPDFPIRSPRRRVKDWHPNGPPQRG